jgi:hypothetical protein
LKRAKARRSEDKPKHGTDTAAIAKPSLDEEIKLFKTICRYILQNDLQDEQRTWSRMDQRMHLRRLAPLGIEGNQPAVAAYCEVTKEEDDTITKAILQQKVGANPKAMKAHNELKEEQNGQGTILYRKARIAYRATVRWKRNISPSDNTNRTTANDGHDATG